MKTKLTFSIIYVILAIVLSNKLSAQKQAEYTLPFYFEDASGAKDTIYYLFDKSAKDEFDDPQFGEIPVIIDSTRFGVYFHDYCSRFDLLNCINFDSVYQTIVSDLNEHFEMGMVFGSLNMENTIMIYKPNLPVTLTIPFDSLIQIPFVREFGSLIEWGDQDWLHSLEIRGYSYLPYSDSNILEEQIYYRKYWGQDSLDFTLTLQTPVNNPDSIEWVFFEIVDFRGIEGINDQYNSNQFILFPTLLENQLHIRSELLIKNDASVHILDCLGKEVHHSNLVGTSMDYSIMLGNLPKGVYSARINFINKAYIYKVVKI